MFRLGNDEMIKIETIPCPMRGCSQNDVTVTEEKVFGHICSILCDTGVEEVE